MSVSLPRLLVTFVVAGLAVGPSALSAKPPSQSNRLTLKIDETFPGTASGVRGDGERSQDGLSSYVDNSLPGGDPCVTAKLQSSGFAFIYLDWIAPPGDCAASLGITPRTFVLQLPGSACDALGIGPDPCTLRMAPGIGEEPLSHPRIRLTNLNSKKAQTPVAFLFVHSGVSYEVQSGADVPFTKSGSTWTLVNNPASGGGRSFSLVEVGGGTLASGFDLLFDLVVEKP